MFDQFHKSTGGAFAPLLDTKWVRDPWNLGIEIEVLRTDHEDWNDWKESISQANSPAEKIVKARMEEELAAEMQRAADDQSKGEAPRAGFRTQKRETKADRAKRLAALKSVDVDYRKIASRALANISLDDLKGSDVNTGKKGIALLLIRNWRGVTEDGTPIQCTLQNRLKLLGWDGLLVWVPVQSGIVPDLPQRWREHATGGAADLNPVLLTRTEAEALDPASRLSQAIVAGQLQVERFPGAIRGADGQPLWVTSGPNQFIGSTVGDALANWIIEEGDALGERAADAVAAAEANLDAGPSGGPNGSTLSALSTGSN